MAHPFAGLALSLAISIGLAVPAPADSIAATCVPAAQCCKICSKGQACGNTCISRTKTCHKDRGCACDAAEICPASQSDGLPIDR
jgi:hypothetical protein